MFITPPSTSRVFLNLTGVKTEGIDIDALIASNKLPFLKTTSLLFSKSVAVAVKSRGKSSMLESEKKLG